MAIQNHGINKFTKDKAIEYITAKPISTEFLARVITYYNTYDQMLNYPQLVKHYRETAYTEAESYLKEKFKMIYTTPLSVEESLFFAETLFQ
jgi:hypothetical protein